jgi:thioesterase domain-containing protein
LSQRLRLSIRQVLKRVSVAIGMSEPKPDPSSLRPEELRAQMSAGRRGSSLSKSSATASMTPAMQRAAEVAKEALKRYQPRFYPGKINFVRAKTVTDFPADPVAVWAGLAKEFASQTVPGDHLGMIANHPETLAEVISRHLNDVRVE